MKPFPNREYTGFVSQIKARIREAQYKALRAVNAQLVQLYWDIGESIYRKQTELGWGKGVVESLAKDLQAEFPGRNEFSARNLWHMRDFYIEHSARPKPQPLVAEVSWAKNLLILSQCKNDLEREFSNAFDSGTKTNPAMIESKVLEASDEPEIGEKGCEKNPGAAEMSTKPIAQRSAKGAAQHQPGATPQEHRPKTRQGLKARPNLSKFRPSLQPLVPFPTRTQSVALGCNKVGALPLMMGAENSDGLKHIQAHLK